MPSTSAEARPGTDHGRVRTRCVVVAPITGAIAVVTTRIARTTNPYRCSIGDHGHTVPVRARTSHVTAVRSSPNGQRRTTGRRRSPSGVSGGSPRRSDGGSLLVPQTGRGRHGPTYQTRGQAPAFRTRRRPRHCRWNRRSSCGSSTTTHQWTSSFTRTVRRARGRRPRRTTSRGRARRRPRLRARPAPPSRGGGGP